MVAYGLPRHSRPGTHLPLREPQARGQLRLPPDGDVSAVVKLLLQLQSLVVAVDDAVLVLGAGLACGQRRGEMSRCEPQLDSTALHIFERQRVGSEKTHSIPLIRRYCIPCLNFKGDPPLNHAFFRTSLENQGKDSTVPGRHIARVLT